METETAEHLTAAIEQLSDDINGLMEVAEQGTLLKQLVEEIRVLREAIDDLRAEVEWAARNVLEHGEPRPWPAPLTSFPRDPCDPEFASKVNAVARHDLSADDEEPMFDEDAEIFREPVEDGEENDDVEWQEVDRPAAPRPATPALEPPAAPPPMIAPPAAPVAERAERKSMARKQPLVQRLYLQRHLEEVVRLLGHEEHPAEDLQQMVQPLYERHGAELVKAAIDELVSFSHRERQAFARLKPDVRKLAVQIIGRPPADR